ncbi:MAG: thiamine-phosphate kinase [Alphaproteobacteria bacterium]
MPGDSEKPARPGEFDLIDRYFKPLATSLPGAFGLTDDAATICPADGNEFVVTTDTIVETVHYLGGETPGNVAAKLMRVNLSDLAAKGAVPAAYSLNLALSAKIDDAWLLAFSAGLAAEQEEFGIGLLGGDTVSTTGPLVLTITAMGEVARGTALHRFGANPGDRLFVTGTIGDGALGLLAATYKLADLDQAENDYLRNRYERPDPRVTVGPKLIGLATAAMDVSDGLIADCTHMAVASGLAATIDTITVPLSDAAATAIAMDPDLLETALTGGDDYEILFAAPESRRGQIAELAAETGVPITEIGSLVKGSGVVARDADGNAVSFAKPGYLHG